MFFDDMDELFYKIWREIFCEQAIALPLKKRHDIYTRQTLKNTARHTTRPLFNIRLSKGRAPRGLSFSSQKKHIL